MKSRNNPRRKKTGRFSWQLLLLVVLILLLTAALGMAIWLSRGEEVPPETEAPLGTEGTQQPTAVQTEPSETSQPTEATELETQPPTEPVITEPTEATEPQKSSGPKKPNNSSNSGSHSASTVATEPPNLVVDSGLVCDQYSLFSGQFVEDGRDELVSNVAAILVTNRSGRFLDLATIKYDIDGKEATFIVTGLPSGRSAWVMEANRLTATADSVFTYVGVTTSFRDDVMASSDKVTITADGNMLTATNNTEEALEGVFIYYRTLHSDGNFLGGITYLVDFGTIEPGASVTKLGGHFSEDSEIVRIGWLTE